MNTRTRNSQGSAGRKQPPPSTQNDSDSDGDIPPSKRAKLEDISEYALNNLINKCVSYILVADQKKHAIKKQDIIKNVFDQDARIFKYVIDKACNILKKTFGLEILGIEDRKNEYLLVNILDRDLGTRDFAQCSALELQKQGLVFYLLTLIFMNENVINEDDLWKALEPLGIDINSRNPHPIFGDIKKHVTVELVKQMYLEYKCVSKDPVQYEFRWGQRAKQEVGKDDILEFACKVMGDCQPQDWVYQYKEAFPQDSNE